MKKVILIFMLFFVVTEAWSQNITTVAGTGFGGYNGDNIPATSAQLMGPSDVCVDDSGNIFIAELDGFRIRKIDHATHIISTIAGNGICGLSTDGTVAAGNSIDTACSVQVDRYGSVYFCENGTNRIRKIDSDGRLQTVAGIGAAGYNGDEIEATSAKLNGAVGIAFDYMNNLIICDAYNNRIRKVESNGIIHTVAGNGIAGYSGEGSVATSSKLNLPCRVSTDMFGGLYITDLDGFRVLKVDNLGFIYTIAGCGIHGYSGDNGAATSAQVSNVGKAVVDAVGNLYFDDAFYGTVRVVRADGVISTVVGVPGHTASFLDNIPATSANLNWPLGIAMTEQGTLYIADYGHAKIRVVEDVASVPNVSISDAVFSIFPNPSIGKIFVQLSEKRVEQIEVFVLDILGNRIVYKLSTSNDPIILNIETAGVYFVNVKFGQSILTKKIVIKN